MSQKPALPQAGTLPLPPEWYRFLAGLLAYVAGLETRVAALDATATDHEKRIAALEKK